VRHGGIAQVVHLCPIQAEQASTETVPAEVKQLIEVNDGLFQAPEVLPPSHAFDHKITLLPGVKPVNVKPYRYSLTKKDLIERQVKEMLANGIIRASHSPFSSPVILVKNSGSCI